MTSDTLDELEVSVRRARSDPGADAVAEAARLRDLEGRLFETASQLTADAPDVAEDLGHPVLADLARWRGRIQDLGLEGAARSADELLDSYVEDEADAWRRDAAAAAAARAPEGCFLRLREATELDLEAISRGACDPSEPPLRGERGALRDAFLTALEARPPDGAQRGRWSTALLDRTDVVLTAIDDLGPAEAGAQLGLVADDVDWHLRNIERGRGRTRTRLKRKLWRLRSEEQERGLQARLEGKFGPKAVGRWERMIIGLILLVLGLLAFEAVFSPPPPVLFWMIVVDTLACLVFLWDFFYRLALVHGKGRWFLRHFLIDLVPSIPFGVLTLGHLGGDQLRAGRAIRLLRLTRVARYVRVLMPVIRTVRATGFLARGFDRMVRRYGHLLNRDIILYPTRQERARAEAQERGVGRRLKRLRAEVTDLWEDLLVTADAASRPAIAAARLEGMAGIRGDGALRAAGATAPTGPVGAREVPAEALVRRLGAVTAEGVVAEMGADFVSRTARAVRIFSKPPLRWLPFLRRFIPPLGIRMTDGQIAAAAARRLATQIRGYTDRWFFFGDLYGTITPAEFVDRVGATLVKGAFRPAYRLILFGALLGIVELMLSITPSDLLRHASGWLGNLVNPIMILGAVAVIVVALGWWLQRVAGEATSFLESTATAQFLPLMESVKGRYLTRDAAVLTRRVFEPEALLRGEEPATVATGARKAFVEGVRAWLLEAQPRGHNGLSFEAIERAVLLYRDGMDGALLDASDTRTTNQLLGNPALRTFLRTAEFVSPKERKDLQALDLASHRRAFSGPYLWFSLVTRSIMHAAARLIVEFNRYAIPLSELPLAAPEARARREAWLGQARTDIPAEEAKQAAEEHVTTAFTALHFLDDDPGRDAEVAERFGEDVLERLRRDRRALFRRIFGTYPLHARPHEQRVVNLYRLYETYFAGGRALLLPLRGLWGGVRWIGRIVGWVVTAVKEITNPRLREEQETEAEADFATAVRKVDRMRGPVVQAALWLRARVDCEYLGVRLPGRFRTGLESHDVLRDLEFLESPPRVRRLVEEERDLAQADVRMVASRIDDGLLERTALRLGMAPDAVGREHVRALVFAWRADLRQVRSLLGADEVLQETALLATVRAMPRRITMPSLSRWVAFRRWWKEHGQGEAAERRAFWNAVRHDVNGARRALDAWRSRDAATRIADGEREVAELLRHPGRLSEQIVTLRIVQVLGQIDDLNYRLHVWNLGRYEEDGEDPRGLLCLDPDAQA